jgi:Retrotransposon gag protein/Zinc knuckle
MAPATPTSSKATASPAPHDLGPQDLMNELVQLRQQVQQLSLERQMLVSGQKDLGEITKPKTPGPYDGNPRMLQGFLTQLKAYHRFYPSKLTDVQAKVLHAGGCMTGTALAWFEPIMRDYLNNAGDDQDDETKEIFTDYEKFEKAIKKTFGSTDEVRTAVIHMDQLRQKGSASDYAARFRQVTSVLDWKDEPLMSAFFKGLKEEIKDELYREDMPNNFSDYVAMAVRIDNRQYQRRMQKQQGRGTWNPTGRRGQQANQKKRREEPIAYGHTLNPGRMELDATKKDDKKEKKCYNCGKPGHFANKCKKPRKEWKPVPEGGKKQLNATNQQKIEVIEPEVEHKNLSWTFCYDDNCYIHLSSKQGTGWFPKEPKKPKKTQRQINQALGITTPPRKPGYEKLQRIPTPELEEIRAGIQAARQSVQEDLDEQSMEKRTLAMTGRKELHELKSPEYLDEDSHQEILNWVRQQAEARKIRREQQYREEQDAQILTTFDEPEDRVREMSVDDDNAILDTPEASEDEQSEEETPAGLTATQEQAVQRYFPAPTGKHFAIPIIAVDTTTILRNPTLWYPEREEGDDPRLSPRHKDHTRLAWASCIFMMCQAHFTTKARLNAFPIRMRGYPIKAPYFRWELLEWRVKIINDDQTMILEPDSNTPIKCRAHTDPTDVCESDTCQLHVYTKNRQWHQYVYEGKIPTHRRELLLKSPRCETKDHMVCPLPNCSEHMVDKAREWHKWQCGTPAAYKRTQRALDILEHKDPRGTTESTYHNEQKLDKWYNEQKFNPRCNKKHAVNCDNPRCEKHEEMKDQIYNRLCQMFNDGFCFKHPQNGTGPTEWYQEMKRQIAEESIPENSKNEARHL